MRVVIFDNLDSFTHNLAQLLGGLGADVIACRPGRGPAACLSLRPDRIVLSPGPGRPEDAGECGRLLLTAAGQVPILGVCLGMQLTALAFGGRVVRGDEPVHGRASPVSHDGQGIFRGLPHPLVAGRYHSLAVVPASLPPSLRPTAWAGDVLMGLRHATLAIEGVQFHPESVLTPDGTRLLANFLGAEPPCTTDRALRLPASG